MRTKALQDFIDEITMSQVGLTQKQAHDHQVCVWCGQPVISFRDKLSQKEYNISGFCQRCQDKIFGK